MAAIFKILKPLGSTAYGNLFLYQVSLSLGDSSPRKLPDKFMSKEKKNNKKRDKNNKSPKLCFGDLISMNTYVRVNFTCFI